MSKLDLTLPGNRRYQPKSLLSIFGYDNLYIPVVAVIVTVMRVLAKMGIISAEDIALLTPEVEAKLLAITTTEVDRVEKTNTPEYGKATGHDIRALVRIMQSILPEPLRRWVYVPLTSYDGLDTGRTLMFIAAQTRVIRPKLAEIITVFAHKVLQYADLVQIGRTHGQHALPITVGFWLATILNRIVYNAQKMDAHANALIGKISGAVGAHNAQIGLAMHRTLGGPSLEEAVLGELNLKRGPISTQIVQPEPLAYYLFSVVMESAALGQFGRDCRNLMRSEIDEVSEPFSKGQIGSSTMAHKRNPVSFEGIEGGFHKNRNEFGKVFDTLISEHQRDLVGSSLMRDFPTIIVNLMVQIETLLRKDPEADNKTFVERIVINKEALERNLKMSGGAILAEPLYIALQMAGYAGDAHEIVNRHIVPTARKNGWDLPTVIEEYCAQQPNLSDLSAAWAKVSTETKRLLRNPERYIGDAAQQARDVASSALVYVDSLAA